MSIKKPIPQHVWDAIATNPRGHIGKIILGLKEGRYKAKRPKKEYKEWLKTQLQPK